MSGNKASFYRIPTKAEENRAKTPVGKVTDTSVLTESAIYRAMQELQQSNPNFSNLTTTAALNEVEKKLEDMGFKGVNTSRSTITGPGGANFYVRQNRNKTGFVLIDKKK